MTRIVQKGHPSAPVWIIGEAPGKEEDERGVPFVGASGIELDKLLREAGIDCPLYYTNVCHVRPPSFQKNGKWVHNDIEQFFLTKTAATRARVPAIFGKYPTAPIVEGLSHLREMLQAHSPVLVVALGNTALWALTGHYGITKWRGSVFDTSEGRDRGPAANGGKVIATMHPADVLRSWTHRPVVLQDLRRAKREAAHREVRRPSWNFTIPSSISTVRDWFQFASTRTDQLVCDTEGWGRVDCIGFACSSSDAICIPLKHETNYGADFAGLHYWPEDEEIELSAFLRTILTSHDMTFHNAPWDAQVLMGSWRCIPRLRHDTQAAQHVAFPGLIGGKIDPVTGEVKKGGSSLSLSFIASMYCDYYRFWKDDGRHFDPAVGDEVDYWKYNCEDCVRTFEAREALLSILEAGNLTEQYEHVMRGYALAFAMMFRGLPYDRDSARTMRQRLLAARDEARRWLCHVTETDFNPWSAPQCKDLFYRDFDIPLILNKDTKAATLDDAALDQIKRKHPLLSPLVSQIQNFRTLDTVKDDVDPNLAPTGTLYFGLNPAYVETMRFSGGETAWGEGGNVQNIKRPDGE